ncbi:tetratricopeptide repeat protein [Janthinobacterium sp. NKUCC06_STL]|uniref:tetratricopeptide repeat protein n=1 Tax=Janthinobacterium sp. NKUCC06_STL TaxID=2842127 RepID=UPI001C5ABA61|nr:SEL1-like repeat protein [Janthinobacterium sp. NKUCC06_STL]MBW3512277.1 SEL1-like repeat protein [Janthinobacterium sp. NKUCC06_STL]
MMLANLLLAAALASPVAAAAPEVTARAKVLMRADEASQPQARTLFEQAAGQGSGPAAYYLGLMFKNGMGGPQDSAAALRWLELAAQRGVAPAMFIVANMLLESDEARARYWLDAACEREHPEALMQKAIATKEGAMGYARSDAQSTLLIRMAEHAMGHRGQEP